jgi:hypothetical protein
LIFEEMLKLDLAAFIQKFSADSFAGGKQQSPGHAAIHRNWRLKRCKELWGRLDYGPDNCVGLVCIRQWRILQ